MSICILQIFSNKLRGEPNYRRDVYSYSIKSLNHFEDGVSTGYTIKVIILFDV